MFETIKQMLSDIRKNDSEASKHTELDDLVELYENPPVIKDESSNN